MYANVRDEILQATVDRICSAKCILKNAQTLYNKGSAPNTNTDRSLTPFAAQSAAMPYVFQVSDVLASRNVNRVINNALTNGSCK